MLIIAGHFGCFHKLIFKIVYLCAKLLLISTYVQTRKCFNLFYTSPLFQAFLGSDLPVCRRVVRAGALPVVLWLCVPHPAPAGRAGWTHHPEEAALPFSTLRNLVVFH